jgi:hypothetical protein
LYEEAGAKIKFFDCVSPGTRRDKIITKIEESADRNINTKITRIYLLSKKKMKNKARMLVRFMSTRILRVTGITAGKTFQKRRNCLVWVIRERMKMPLHKFF